MRLRIFVPAAVTLCAAGIAAVLFLQPARTVHAASAAVQPAYDKNGNLLRPSDYREWVYLSSGLDMSYTANANSGHSMFDNVFVNPEAYRSFLKTGTWPDKTMLVLELRGAQSKGSINVRGHYQGTDVMGVEVHVKDEARFSGEWAFFGFDSPTGHGKLLPQSAACYSCHEAHGAVDTTFVQFYPTLLPIAQRKGTLSKGFLADGAASGAR